MKTQIAVVGNDGGISNGLSNAAEMIGKNIAERDCVLVCGGRGGVMQAACSGARKAGGLTVGILPSSEKTEANEFVDVAVPTGIGFARNAIVVSSADAVIALAGSTGTLTEIGMALNYGKPVVVVSETGGVSEKIKSAFQQNERIQKIVVARKEDAVEKALELIG